MTIVKILSLALAANSLLTACGPAPEPTSGTDVQNQVASDSGVVHAPQVHLLCVGKGTCEDGTKGTVSRDDAGACVLTSTKGQIRLQPDGTAVAVDGAGDETSGKWSTTTAASASIVFADGSTLVCTWDGHITAPTPAPSGRGCVDSPCYQACAASGAWMCWEKCCM